jgi:hypothetical protein
MSSTSPAPAPSAAPAVTTPVAAYRDLRLMAEWASSIRGREVEFVLGEDALRVAGEETAPRTPALRVPARTPGRYGAVRALVLRVAGVDGALDLAAYGADAMAWSEAAVEKFLVPYYASCAGPRAGEFLTSLFDAWNGVHRGARPVALAHLGHTRGEAPLTLEDTLGVVFVAEGEEGGPPELRLLTLGAFRARHPGRWTPPPPADAGTVELGARNLPEGARLPTYADLRALAEWAGSLRGRTAFLAYDAAPVARDTLGEERISRIPDPGRHPASRIVFPVHTPVEVPGRPKPVSVTLQAEDGSTVDLLHDTRADAAFTSTGAVEQFLTPYYASVRGRLAPAELRRIFRAWQDPEEALAGVGVRSVEAEGDGSEATLAMVHLPRSDWDTESGGEAVAASPLDHLGVLRRGAEGGLRLLTVAGAAGEE